LSKEEEGSVRSRVAAYQERQNLWGQVVQALTRMNGFPPAGGRTLEYRVEQASTAARTREAGKSSSPSSDAGNTERYVAEETTVIEGQKIVARSRHCREGREGPHSSCWRVSGERGSLGRDEAPCRTGYRMDASRMNQIERKLVLFTFLLPSPSRWPSWNIPLAVFAFFGGILAIGIGSGPAPHRELHQQRHPDVSTGPSLWRTSWNGGAVRSGEVHRPAGARASARFDGWRVLVPNSHSWSRRYELDAVGPEVATNRRGAAYGSPTRETSGRILASSGRTSASYFAEPVVLFESFRDNGAELLRAFFWLALGVRGTPGRMQRSPPRMPRSSTRRGSSSPSQRDVHLDTKVPIEVKVLPGIAALRKRRAETDWK